MTEKLEDSEACKLSGGWRFVTLDVLFLLMCIDTVRLLNHEVIAEELDGSFLTTLLAAIVAVLLAVLVGGFIFLLIPSVYRMGKKKSSGTLASWLCSIPAIFFFLMALIDCQEYHFFSLSLIWLLAASFKLVRCSTLREFMPLWSASMVAEGGCSILIFLWIVAQTIVYIILPFVLIYRFIEWLF